MTDRADDFSNVSSINSSISAGQSVSGGCNIKVLYCHKIALRSMEFKTVSSKMFLHP
jgi:hypothetical protein